MKAECGLQLMNYENVIFKHTWRGSVSSLNNSIMIKSHIVAFCNQNQTCISLMPGNKGSKKGVVFVQ